MLRSRDPTTPGTRHALPAQSRLRGTERCVPYNPAQRPSEAPHAHFPHRHLYTPAEAAYGEQNATQTHVTCNPLRSPYRARHAATRPPPSPP